ncbi:MAG: hypothetical protein R3255_07505, partial [Candidatus Lokiarchaeia archaeon]|nr:hypothetical protein [Candidatus Lokiarchaeia archaeon]
MNFSNNKFNDIREIHGFAKTEILDIKNTVLKLISEDSEGTKLDEYLKSKLHLSSNLYDNYSRYIEDLKSFTDKYVLSTDRSEYFYLKSEVLEELQLLSDNLQNLSSNIRNVKRIIKKHNLLEDTLIKIERLLKESTQLGSEIQQSIKDFKSIQEDTLTMWTEINRIKNLNFKLNEVPQSLEDWSDIKELITFIISLNDVIQNKSKKDKKERILTFHFEEIYQFFNSKDESKIKFYSDLIYLLYSNGIYELFQGEEFINILERKEVIQNLKKYINPLLIELIEKKLQPILNEIEQFDLKEKDDTVDLKNLKQQKISIFLPKLIEYYFNGLE